MEAKRLEAELRGVLSGQVGRGKAVGAGALAGRFGLPDRTVRLNKSSIEYLDFNWSFLTGCAHWQTGVCPVGDYCWAKRLDERYGTGAFKPELHPEGLLSPLAVKKPSTIGVCFTGDLFGGWVDPEQTVQTANYETGLGEASMKGRLREVIQAVCQMSPQHRFLFLTKAPQNYQNWTEKWPDNAWLGASAWDKKSYFEASRELRGILAHKRGISVHKWVSIEPLLGRTMEPWMNNQSDVSWLQNCGISLVVIGAATGSKRDMIELQEKYPALNLAPFQRKWSLQPPVEWVREIVEACDRAGVKIWLKNNLAPSIDTSMDWAFPGFKDGGLRQEMPEDSVTEKLKAIDTTYPHNDGGRYE